nr:MAG: hypothetical protein [Bacteriophage sp.]
MLRPNVVTSGSLIETTIPLLPPSNLDIILPGVGNSTVPLSVNAFLISASVLAVVNFCITAPLNLSVNSSAEKVTVDLPSTFLVVLPIVKSKGFDNSFATPTSICSPVVTSKYLHVPSCITSKAFFLSASDVPQPTENKVLPASPNVSVALFDLLY